ncbi:ROK family glucokinase [Brevibacillus humidisoli]|uniref:ROK family glucokinase n=1 Tax=Brevibacillus humidisoli TaxID=2895522 RepID=UPI001E3EEED1|nr:ROK family glucokinase [Brevibacillus humidisoli]UFJ41071.1 ROK family glucokinase [Brevibacillus humidisoli]
MAQTMIAGVDLGGTAIKAALLTMEGDILRKTQVPTPVTEGADRVIGRMMETIDQLLAEEGQQRSSLAGIGIGVPGPVDEATGSVHEAVNLYWKSVPLKQKLEQLSGLSISVDNDANTAALGEMWRGAGQGAKDMVAITLGTGVGGGVIANGRIIHGVRGVGGEIGHVTVVPAGGPLCNCGRTGCLETFASATAIIREGTQVAAEGKSETLAAVLEQNGALTAKDVFDAAKAGDAAAVKVVDDAAYYLGLGLSHLANILNPGKIVIGGGVAAAGDFLFERVREEFRRYTFSHAAESCEIVPAILGNDAGVIGAAWLVHEQQIGK